MKKTSYKKDNLEDSWRVRFEKYAQKYDADYHIAGWSEHSHRRRIVTFQRALNTSELKKNSLILDLGCGAATYCKLLRNKGHRVVGIDYSLFTLKKASSNVQDDNIDFIHSEAYHLPFKNDAFDAVLCIGVFQTLSDENKVISEISRILKNDGIFFLDTLNKMCLSVIMRYVKKIIFLIRKDNNDSLRTYNPFQLTILIRRHSLKKIKIIGTYIFPRQLLWTENFFEKLHIFKIMDNVLLFFLPFAKATMIMAKKMSPSD